MEATFAEKKV